MGRPADRRLNGGNFGVSLLRGAATGCIFVLSTVRLYSDAFVLIENEIWVVLLALA